MSARIRPLARTEGDSRIQAEFQRIEWVNGYVPNMHLTFGRHPELYAAWLPFAVHIMPNSTLEARHRQLLILRTSYVWRARYSWAHHVRISLATADFADKGIAAVEAGSGDSSWSPVESALLRACDEMRAQGAIQESTWSILCKHFSDHQLMDIVFTIGQYTLIATALNSFRVALDDGFALPSWATPGDVE